MAMAADWNSYFLMLGWPEGPYIDVWWRVGGATSHPCADPDVTFGPKPRPEELSPTEAYDRIRHAPTVDTSDETPFRFAGAIGRAVDIRIDSSARARCAGATVLLTGAGKGYEAGHITLARDGVTRLATVEVDGHELLIAMAGSSVEDLDRAGLLVQTFRVGAPAVPGTPGPGP